MKKVLALVLAVVLAFGMTTVAFAATTRADNVTFGSAIYTFDKTTRTVVTGAPDLSPNTTYYLEILTATNTDGTVLDSGKISTYSDLRIRTTIEDGGAYISAKPSIVIKKTGTVNKPYVTFKTADKFNKDAADITMTIEAYKGGDSASAITTINASTIAYVEYEAESVFTIRDAGGNVSFTDVEDTEIYFGKVTDTYFAVNATGQKDLFLRLDTADDAMEDKYPEASLDFFYFAGNNNTFRRSGTLHLPTDMVENKDGKLVPPYLYENVNGKLSLIAGGDSAKKAGPSDVKYNEDLGEYTLKTNKLGKYVVSDIALKEAASSTTDGADGAETNPDTGANDFVGLAVALAVVSVAGIAVAKRK